MRYIVIDKEIGASWVNDTLEEVMISMGYDPDVTEWDHIKYTLDLIYTVIEVEGNVKFIVESV